MKFILVPESQMKQLEFLKVTVGSNKSVVGRFVFQIDHVQVTIITDWQFVLGRCHQMDLAANRS